MSTQSAWPQNGQQPNQPAYNDDPNAYAAPVATPETRSQRIARMIGAALVILGAALAMVGLFGPWEVASSTGGQIPNFSLTANGFNSVQVNPAEMEQYFKDQSFGPGIKMLIAAGIGLVTGVMLLLGKKEQQSGWACAALGAAVAFFAGISIPSINDDIAKAKPDFQSMGAALEGGIGWGLWLALAGGIAMILGGAYGALRGKK